MEHWSHEIDDLSNAAPSQSLISSAGTAFEEASSAKMILPAEIRGQAFCFLPLPVLTQLPIHVNGYFELSSNRRDIWRGDDASGEARVRGEWNDLVMRDVLASLYAKLLMVRVKQLRATVQERLRAARDDDEAETLSSVSLTISSQILKLLPCPPPAAPWKALADALFPLLSDLEVVLCSTSTQSLYCHLADIVEQSQWRLFPRHFFCLAAPGRGA